MIENEQRPLPLRTAKKKTSNIDTRNIFYLKIGLILALILTGLIFAFLASKKFPQKKEVLGTETKGSIAGDIKDQAEDFAIKTKITTEGLISKTVGNVLSETTKALTKTINETASKSAETVTDYIFKNTIVNVIKQIENLPPKQQEDIRNEICK